MPAVYKPTELDHALGIVASAQSPVVVLAGGTDLYPAHVGRKMSGPVLDISQISSLALIEQIERNNRPALKIGAAVKWSAITARAHAALRSPLFDCLVMAAREIGGVQIQNLGTVVGNLCNASPAADGVPALQALDGQIRLASQRGVREISLVEFITGPRQTALSHDEIVESIVIPLPAEPSDTASHSLFLKLGHRRYLVISAVMSAVRLDWQGDTVAGAAISVGACGPTAVRLENIEEQLVGSNAAQLMEIARTAFAPQALTTLTPIDDLRGSAQYRVNAADQLVRRSIAAMAQAPGQSLSMNKAQS